MLFRSVLVSPGLGFGGAEAAESPLAVDEVVGGEDEGFGVDAGFEGVHGGDGFACDRGGAGRFLGVAAVSFNLSESRHRGSGNGDRRSQRARARPALRIEEGFRGFGGEYL